MFALLEPGVFRLPFLNETRLLYKLQLDLFWKLTESLADFSLLNDKLMTYMVILRNLLNECDNNVFEFM